MRGRPRLSGESRSTDAAAGDHTPGAGTAHDVPDTVVASGPAGQAEAELAARLRVVLTRLHRHLRQQSVGGLTPSQGSALAAIERLGMPTLGELAAREGVQPPSVTRIVGALEGMGLVRRVADESDRRVSRVGLLPEGRRTLARNRSARTAYLAARLQRLAPEERAALADLIALLERIEDREDIGDIGDIGDEVAP